MEDSTDLHGDWLLDGWSLLAVEDMEVCKLFCKLQEVEKLKNIFTQLFT